MYEEAEAVYAGLPSCSIPCATSAPKLGRVRRPRNRVKSTDHLLDSLRLTRLEASKSSVHARLFHERMPARRWQAFTLVARRIAREAVLPSLTPRGRGAPVRISRRRESTTRTPLLT